MWLVAQERKLRTPEMLAASASDIEIVRAKFIASTIFFAAHAALVSLASSCSAVRTCGLSVLAEASASALASGSFSDLALRNQGLPRVAPLAIERCETLPRVAPLAIERCLVPIIPAHRLPTQQTPPMRRPLKGWGGRAGCLHRRTMQAISRGALPGQPDRLRDASAAMAESASSAVLWAPRFQGRLALAGAPLANWGDRNATRPPAGSRSFGTLSASSPIEKPMVATSSSMATNETGGGISLDISRGEFTSER